MSKNKRNRAFEYKTAYAPIWNLLTPLEKKQVLFERASHFIVFREARNYLAQGKYGITDEVEEEVLDDEIITSVELYSAEAEPVALTRGMASNPALLQIYRLLLNQPHQTAEAIAVHLNVSKNTVVDMLKRLREAGIVRVGNTVRHPVNHKETYTYEVVHIEPESEKVYA